MTELTPPKPGPDWVNLGLVALLLVGAGVMGWREIEGDDAVLPTDSLAPQYSFETLGGKPVSSLSTLGRVVVIDFWATWCPPCREELPWLTKLGDELDGRGVTLIAANMDERQVQAHELPSFLLDYPGLERFVALSSGEHGHEFQVRALPTLFILDRAGKVVFSKEGTSQEWVVRKQLEEALARP